MTVRIAATCASYLLALTCTGCGGDGATREITSDYVVPFDLVRNQILVQVSIGRRGPFSCTVDTGANPSAIDHGLAQELGLTIDKEAAPAEGVGTADVLVSQTEFAVSLGGEPPSTIEAVAMNLSSLSEAFGRPLHCVLGQSWLGRRVVQIDYPSAKLRFSANPVSSPQGLNCGQVPMTYWMPDDLMPLVTVEVNGVDLPVSLDTGSSSVLKLFPEGARAAGIATPSPDQPAHQSFGARGTAQIHKVTIASLRFGPLSMTNAQGSIGEKNLGEPEGRLGNIGNGLLRQGVVTLDFPARQIRVCSSPAASK